jgi:hypothetical protein
VGLDEQREADRSIIADIRREAEAGIERLRRDLRLSEAAAQEAQLAAQQANAVRAGLADRVRSLQSALDMERASVSTSKIMIQQLNAQLALVSSSIAAAGGAGLGASLGASLGDALSPPPTTAAAALASASSPRGAPHPPPRPRGSPAAR